MELTDKQKRIISRYRLLPGFLQVRRMRSTVDDLIHALDLENIESIDYDSLYLELYKVSKVAGKFAILRNNIIGIIPDLNESQKEMAEDFASLPIRSQERFLRKLPDDTFNSIYRYLPYEIQEKYISRIMDNSIGPIIVRMPDEIKRNHIIEILEKNGEDPYILSGVWDSMTEDLRDKYFETFIKTRDYYYYELNWNGLSIDGQRKYMEEIIGLLNSPDYDGDFNRIWMNTKDELKGRYFRTFAERAFNYSRSSREHSKEYVFDRLWEYTPDDVQNSEDGVSFIFRLNKDELSRIFKFTNSKLQSQLIARTINRYKASDKEAKSEIINTLDAQLRDAKDKVFEMNFRYLLRSLEDIDHATTLLYYCPTSVLEENSELIGKFFSRNLEKMYSGGNNLDDYFNAMSRILDANSCAIIIKNFDEKNLHDKRPEIMIKFLSRDSSREKIRNI